MDAALSYDPSQVLTRISLYTHENLSLVDVNNLQVELRSMNILLTTPLTKRLENTP